MDIDLPVRGLEPLTPLLAWLVAYVIVLILLRLALWPFLIAIKNKRTLPKLIARLGAVMVRLAWYGALILGGLWAILALGLGEAFYEWVDTLPGARDVPYGGIILGLMLLMAALLYRFFLRPVFARARKK